MTVKQIGKKRYGVYVNGELVAEFRNKATANLWDQLGAPEQARQSEMYAHTQALAATGMPTTGRIQRTIAARYI